MRGFLLGLALVFFAVSGASAETPERKGGELSALDSLKATVEATGGILDVGNYAVDIRGIVIPPNLRPYWESMRIMDVRIGKESGEDVYSIFLMPLEGILERPYLTKAVYRLEATGESDKRSGKLIHRVGKMLYFLANGVLADTTTESPKGLGSAPKSNDRCTIAKPCDEMKRQAPCPHHDNGKCEHMEKHQKDQQKKDRGIAI